MVGPRPETREFVHDYPPEVRDIVTSFYRILLIINK